MLAMMETHSHALLKTITVSIIVLIIGLAFLGLYLAGYFFPSHTTVKLFGSCQATSYSIPDTIQVSARNVTTVEGNTTSYYMSYSTGTFTTLTLGHFTYTTTLYTNVSTSFVVTNTTNSMACEPSACYTISTCTYGP